MKKVLKIIIFLAMFAILSFSVNADKIPDSWQYIGMGCSPGGSHGYGNCPCELYCAREDGSAIPQGSYEAGTCKKLTSDIRTFLAINWDEYGNPECCVIATSGGKMHVSQSASSVSNDNLVENTYGEIYVFKKNEAMDWASNNGLNLPQSYPYLTLSPTPVHPIDVCTITYLNEYPPWSSSPEFNYGCYNIVPCKDVTLETHYTLIKIHPGVTGEGINPEYFDGLQRDVCVCGAADIYRTFHFSGIQTKDGKKVGTETTIFNGSQLEVLEPEFIDWTGSTEVYYPFVFTSNETWEVNVELYVDEGLEVVTNNPVVTLIENESKIIQFRVKEITEGAGAAVAGAAVLFDVGHAGTKQRDVSLISSAAVKKGEPAKVTMQVKPAEGETQKSTTEIANIEEGQVSSEFLLFAGVALIIIIAIALYMSLMKKK